MDPYTQGAIIGLLYGGIVCIVGFYFGRKLKETEKQRRSMKNEK